MFETLSHATPHSDKRYLANLIRKHRLRTVIEVGCFVGETTRELVDANPQVIVHCIDHLQGSPADANGRITAQHGAGKIREVFCSNLRDVLFQRVFLHVGTSEAYAKLWPFQVDMVYIDADHRYQQVRNDIARWRRHVRPGGFLCGHDYGGFPGVTAAVDEIEPDEVSGFVWMKQIVSESQWCAARGGGGFSALL